MYRQSTKTAFKRTGALQGHSQRRGAEPERAQEDGCAEEVSQQAECFHTAKTALDRMRLRLLQRLELEHQAAQAFVDGQSFTEEVEPPGQAADTGEKTLIKQHRAYVAGGGRIKMDAG